MSTPAARSARPALSALLPHRAPFLLLDRVLALEPGTRAIASKNLTSADPFIAADGAWPAVLLLEVMAQTAGLASVLREADMAMLAAVDRFRSRGSVIAGDTLIVTAHVQRRFGTAVLTRTAVYVEQRCRAAAELILRFR